ncbi:MAG: helix-turn-helix domain-containing protein, partial [Methylocella sp.]
SNKALAMRPGMTDNGTVPAAEHRRLGKGRQAIETDPVFCRPSLTEPAMFSRRLENCRKDLLSQSRTGQRVSDIALRWGFNDFSHFSRAFKQSFGHAPRDYRQRNGASG